MREFFELVNEYPWTTVFLVIGIGFLLEELGSVLASIIHGHKHDVIINTEDKEND